MKKILSKLIVSIISIITAFSAICFSDDIMTGSLYHIWDSEYVSGISLPWIVEYDLEREWSDNLLLIAKEMLARAIQYLPMLVLVVLLLACIKIIFEWDWKEWLKRIKYILIWVALMIICIYVVNILSTIFMWHALLNINFHRW